jgi:hypothetical protein
VEAKDLETIGSAARNARGLFESRRVPPELLAALYSSYHPVRDALDFVAAARRLFPRLNCGLASVFLRHLIGGGAVTTGTYAGELHTFLLMDSRLVVDITADQFGGPGVYVGPLVAPWALPTPECAPGPFNARPANNPDRREKGCH